MSDLKTIFSVPFKQVDMNAIIGEAMQRNEERILELNKRQLDAGIGADGKSIGRYANFSYKNRFEPVDLKLTGKFRNEFTLGIKKREAEIFSQDAKQKSLEKKYGKDIQGLTSSNEEIAGGIILEDVQRLFFQSLIIAK